MSNRLNRVVILLPDNDLNEIDNWTRKHGIGVRANAIRKLIQIALKAQREPDEKD